jgi:methionyl aminopeptidase
MKIELLSGPEQDRMRAAGASAAATLGYVGARLRPGMSTADIDALVRSHTADQGGVPAQLGYQGFAGAACTSRNDVVCHGIPSRTEMLEQGDIINVDVTTRLHGYHGDTSRTFAIGEVSDSARHVIDVARRCLHAGIEQVRPGARLGDIGAAILELATAAGCGVVREYGGHGIGRHMHMDPHVPHVGRRGGGPRLRAGMAFTIEPMITLGSPRTRLLGDGWTVLTADGRWTAQFEHTVLVTPAGVEVLTL